MIALAFIAGLVIASLVNLGDSRLSRRRLDQARALRDEGEDLIAQAERREAEALERIAQERAEALRVAEETRQRIEQTSAEVTLSTMFVLRALPRSARVSQ